MIMKNFVVTLCLLALWSMSNTSFSSVYIVNSEKHIGKPSPFGILLQSIKGFEEEMIAFRRDLHMHPELLYQEFRTAEKIKEKLKEFGIDYIGGLGALRTGDWSEETLPYVDFPYVDGVEAGKGTGIIAQIGTGKSPCIALRADMDALPILEEVNVEYKSQENGVMHACGHDAHVTMLLFAAKYLKSMEESIPGTIRLIFQPAEEGGAGGLMMEREGVLSREPKVERIFGLHVHPAYNSGVLASTRGPSHAIVDGFVLTITGKGGHAAMPVRAIHPIPPAAAIISAVSNLMAKETSYGLENSGLISITAINVGSGTNIIPEKAILQGSIRSFNKDIADYLTHRLYMISQQISAAYRCTATLEKFDYRYIVLNNDSELVSEFSEVVGDHEFRVQKAKPSLGGEDFSFFAAKVPGIFVFVGVGGGTKDVNGNDVPTSTPPHNADFAISEEALPYGATAHVLFALSSLAKLSNVEFSKIISS